MVRPLPPCTGSRCPSPRRTHREQPDSRIHDLKNERGGNEETRISPLKDAIISVPIACRLDERGHKMAEGELRYQGER